MKYSLRFNNEISEKSWCICFRFFVWNAINMFPIIIFAFVFLLFLPIEWASERLNKYFQKLMCINSFMLCWDDETFSYLIRDLTFFVVVILIVLLHARQGQTIHKMSKGQHCYFSLFTLSSLIEKKIVWMPDKNKFLSRAIHFRNGYTISKMKSLSIAKGKSNVGRNLLSVMAIWRFYLVGAKIEINDFFFCSKSIHV